MRVPVKILFVSLIAILFCGSCNENRNKTEADQIKVFKGLLKRKAFIPTPIKWDTLNFLPQDSDEILLHQVFPLLYFKDDTTLYIMRSENEILKANRSEPDSILLAVGLCEVFHGSYKVSNKLRLININLKKETEDNIAWDTMETINIIDYKIPVLYYKNQQYIIANNLVKESYNRINFYVHGIPDPEVSGTDPVSRPKKMKSSN